MSGSIGREFFAIMTSRPRDFSVELKMLLEWHIVLMFEIQMCCLQKRDPFEVVNRKDKF